MATAIIKHTLMREDVAAVNPLEYGPALVQSTLESALADNVGRDISLIITPGVWEIAANLAIPDTCDLSFSPGGYIRVAANRQLSLNTAPHSVDGASGRQFFYADGVATGHIRFLKIIGPGIQPEWLGVDPTGTVASNQLWAEIFKVATTNVIHPVLLNGTYRLDNSTDPALSLVNYLQLRGNMRRGNTAIGQTTDHSGKFLYYGAGDAIAAEDMGSSYLSLVIENIYVEDMLQTGLHGMMLWRPTSLTMRNVFVQGFAHGVTVSNGWYYGRTEQLKLRAYRLTGLVATDNLNGNDLDVHLNSQQTTVTTHFGLGVSEIGGSGGQIVSNRIFALIEPSSGIAARLTRMIGGECHVYIEPTGVAIAANMGAYAVSVEYCSGVLFHFFCYLRSLYNTGVFIQPIEAVAGYQANHRLSLHGRVTGSAINDLTVGAGPIYGIDTTGFSPGVMLASGVGTTGVMQGDRYISSGHRAPTVDEGRGSTAYVRNWRVGDIVESNINDPGKFTRFRCTVAGNPGTWVSEGSRPGALAKTTDYSIAINEATASFSNVGATAIVNITLPASTSGSGMWRFRFTRVATFSFRITPASNGLDLIRGSGGMGKYIQLDSDGTTIELELINGGLWELTQQRGTVSYQP